MDFSKIISSLIPQGNAVKIQCDGTTLWEKITSRIPSEYQEVEYITAGSGVDAYIDLGFVFDTGATIHMSQYLDDDTTSTYPFGSVENAVVRCALSLPYTGNGSGTGTLYGYDGEKNIAVAVNYVSNSWNKLILVLKSGHLQAWNITNNKTGVYTAQSNYTMSHNLLLFAQWYNTGYRVGGTRKIGYFKYYDKNDELICDLVPCYRKSDGLVGMYDIVRQTFLTKPSKATGLFTAGPLIINHTESYKNWARYAINENGYIYNGGIGYKLGYRVRSGGLENATTGAVCTGYIPFNKGDVLRIYPAFTGANSVNTINFYDSNFTNLGQSNDSGSLYGICVNTEIYRTTNADNISTLVYTDSFDSSVAYIRVTHDLGKLDENAINMIITVNQEIPV